MEEISKITPQDLNQILEALIDRGYLPRQIKDNLGPDKFLDLYETVAERLETEFQDLPEDKADRPGAKFWAQYLEADEIDKRHLTGSLLDHSIPDILADLGSDTLRYSLVGIIDSYLKDLIIYMSRGQGRTGRSCIGGLA